MYDETQKKIMDAAMNLILEHGYPGTTTKDIAKKAGVNESTIFRRFKGKKEIVLTAIQRNEWFPDIKKEDFADYTNNMQEDLKRFSRIYTSKVTPKMVKISIGLRSPDLYPDTAEEILKVPTVFKDSMEQYFKYLYDNGRISRNDFEHMAMMFLSLNFGFVFMISSFERNITAIDLEDYITHSIEIFTQGL